MKLPQIHVNEDVLKEIANIGIYRIPNAHVFSPKEAFSNFNESHLVEFWDKSDPWKSKTSQTVLDSVFCYLHTYSEVSLLKTTTTQLIENGDVKSIPTYNLFSYLQCLWWRNYRESSHKSTVRMNPVTNPCIYNSTLPERRARAMVAQSLWE